MQTAAALSSLWHDSLLRLTGPVFDKESRRASRRARNYAMRTGYIVLLSVLALSAFVWKTCFVLSASTSPKMMSVGLCSLSVAASIFFVLTAGLYFGVRLRTTTAAAAATVGAYLCLNYIVRGRFNPVFGWPMWKIVYHAGARTAAVYLLGFGMGTAAFVRDTGLGFFLVRWAQQMLRRRVF